MPAARRRRCGRRAPSESPAEVTEIPGLRAVYVFRDATGEDHTVHVRAPCDALGQEQPVGRFVTVHGSDDQFGHRGGDLVEGGRFDTAAQLEVKANGRGVGAPARFDAGHGVAVDGDQPPADVQGRSGQYLAVVDEREFRRPAADVDVEDARGLLRATPARPRIRRQPASLPCGGLRMARTRSPARSETTEAIPLGVSAAQGLTRRGSRRRCPRPAAPCRHRRTPRPRISPSATASICRSSVYGVRCTRTLEQRVPCPPPRSRLVRSSPRLRNSSRENATCVPELPISIPTLCSVTLSCCQIGLSSSGRSGFVVLVIVVVCVMLMRRRPLRGLRRQVRKFGRVRLVHARHEQAVLGECLGEGLPDHRRLVGVVDLVTADAPADPRLRNTLGVAHRHHLVLEGR